MLGFLWSSSKPKPVDPQPSSKPTYTSDDECKKQSLKTARRTASEPILITPDFNDNPSSGYSSSGSKDKYKNDFRDSGGLQSQSVQELENYAVYKAEETTNTTKNCLRIAEDIRGDATKTLEMLHHQGDQIHRTHEMAAATDKDLSKGEKLLNDLGGMFSKTWKPKKTRDITGPLTTPDQPSKRSENYLEQREKLGIPPAAGGRTASRTPSEPTNAMKKVELEKEKQDDALSDLSNILGDLKGMAADMGSELDRQNKSLDHLSDDVDELNSRVKDANQRTRRLLGK
ncbi:hypothetical protein Pint_23532 [Pistacia integerrima]|uniref:Uncharacterized protein n=1 Tax=Pistacia integerrima TaxID=434235 RepID=A0ACC0YJD0_9ROSI|nr:hypothetical protein Pint_23532 [Pistacia integerrima]